MHPHLAWDLEWPYLLLRALLSPGNLRLTDLGGWMLSPTTAKGHPSVTPETPGQGVSWVEKGTLGLEGEP